MLDYQFTITFSLLRVTGKDEQRARDLFYAMWVPDLFMRRVEANEDWTLMCPHECPGLADVYGQKFVDLYQRYVSSTDGVLFYLVR